jgi:hypothetical protein
VAAVNRAWLAQNGDDTDGDVKDDNDDNDDNDSDEETQEGGGRVGQKKRALAARRKKAAAAKKVSSAKKEKKETKPKVQFWAFGEDSTHHILAIDMATGAIIAIDKDDPAKVEMAGNSFTDFIDRLTDKPTATGDNADNDDDEEEEDDLAGLLQDGEGDDDDDTKSQGSGSDGDDLLDRLEANGMIGSSGGGGSGSDTDDEPYGYQCDACRAVITGVRYSCESCDNFDLWYITLCSIITKARRLIHFSNI